jgi:hypothetical protein
MVLKNPVPIVKAMVKTKGGGSNRIIISVVFDAEREDFTDDKFSPVSIP